MQRGQPLQKNSSLYAASKNAIFIHAFYESILLRNDNSSVRNYWPSWTPKNNVGKESQFSKVVLKKETQ